MNYKENITAKQLLVTCAFLILYIGGASYQGFVVNNDMNRTDQKSYMDYAKEMNLSNYNYVGGRNRMPFFPFLMSFVYVRNLSDQEYFFRGKLANILLSMVLLCLIYFIVRRYFTLLESQIFIFINAFTVFMFKAGYFQCELLFYFMNFCFFLLLFSFLMKPGYFTGTLSGVFAAGAYLTKASIIPSIFCFSFFYIIYHILLPIKDIVLNNDGKFADYLKMSFRYFIILAVFFATFLLTMYPYISTSKKLFGHYFYNVNSTFYIWYDSFDDAVKGTRGHGDRVGWPQMPPDQIPSAKKYFQEHSFNQIAKRLLKGLIIVPARAYFSYGFFKYICLYFLICILIIIKDYQKFWTLFKKRRNFILFLYTASYFWGYYLLYAFYTPIASGIRFALALFLPALFCMFYFIHKFEFNYYYDKLKLNVNAPLIHTVVGIILLTEIFFNLTLKLRAYAGN